MARTETAFGYYKTLGTSHVQLGSDTTSVANLHFNLVNRASTTAKFTAWAAASSWTSGEPTGSDEPALIWQLPIAPGEIVQVSGVMLAASKALVVVSDTATSIDVVVSAVVIS